MGPNKKKTKIAEILFEKFRIPSMLLVSQSVLSL